MNIDEQTIKQLIKEGVQEALDEQPARLISKQIDWFIESLSELYPEEKNKQNIDLFSKKAKELEKDGYFQDENQVSKWFNHRAQWLDK